MNNRFFATKWGCDINEWIGLDNKHQNTIIKMTELMIDRKINLNSDADILLIVQEMKRFRMIFGKQLSLPYPSVPSSPIHMWSPVASPAKR